MKRSIVVVIFLVGIHFGSLGQKTLLINGYLHVGNGEVMPTAAIGIINGKIVSIKNAMTPYSKTNKRNGTLRKRTRWGKRGQKIICTPL